MDRQINRSLLMVLASGFAVQLACSTTTPTTPATYSSWASMGDSSPAKPVDWDPLIISGLRELAQCPACDVQVEPAINLTLLEPSHVSTTTATEGVRFLTYFFLAYIPDRARVYEVRCSTPEPTCALYCGRTDQALAFHAIPSLVAEFGKLPDWTANAIHESSSGFDVEELRSLYAVCKTWPQPLVKPDPRCSTVTPECKPWPQPSVMSDPHCPASDDPRLGGSGVETRPN